MKASIRIDQKEALLNGSDVFGDFVVEFSPKDLTREQREELAACPTVKEAPNVYSYSVNYNFSESGLSDAVKVVEFTDPTIDSLRLILNARIAFKNKRKEEKLRQELELEEKNKKSIRDWFKKSIEDRLSVRSSDVHISWPYTYSYGSDEEVTLEVAKDDKKHIEDIEDLHSAAFWIGLENSLGQRIRKRKADEEHELKILLKEAQFDKWVKQYATDNQKLRLKAGVLPPEEILDAARDDLFKCMNDCERFTKIKASDFCECDQRYSDYEPDVEFSKETKETLTEKEFDMLNNMKLALETQHKDFPDRICSIEVLEHSGRCDSCGCHEERTGFMVRIAVNGYLFSREYYRI